MCSLWKESLQFDLKAGYQRRAIISGKVPISKKTDLALLNVVHARSSRGQSYKDLSSFQRKDLIMMLKKLWAWWFSWILSYLVFIPMFGNWSVFFVNLLTMFSNIHVFSLWSIFNPSIIPIFRTNFLHCLIRVEDLWVGGGACDRVVLRDGLIGVHVEEPDQI